MEEADLFNNIQPIYSYKDFYEFPSTQSIHKEILADLVQFEQYAKFSVDNILAHKVRENITCSFQTNKVEQPRPEKSAKQVQSEFSTQLRHISEGFELMKAY